MKYITLMIKKLISEGGSSKVELIINEDKDSGIYSAVIMADGEVATPEYDWDNLLIAQSPNFDNAISKLEAICEKDFIAEQNDPDKI